MRTAALPACEMAYSGQQEAGENRSAGNSDRAAVREERTKQRLQRAHGDIISHGKALKITGKPCNK
jgi:hypothetical protein